MPELPEVETVRRTLDQLIVGKTIGKVTVKLARIVQKPAEPEQFAAALEGRRVLSVERRGKFLRIVLDGLVLVSHLRMEGRYGVYGREEPTESHTHVVFHFTDGMELRYKDVRQFGTMHLFATGEEWTSAPLNKLGLEPLDEAFTSDAFRRALGQRKTMIKPLLLNQEIVVGLGNIYVDEALHDAGIHPETPANELKRKQLDRLHASIVKTLALAVEAGGSTIRTYVNSHGDAGMFQHRLKVYARAGEPCDDCGTPIEKSVVGGRGTHVCPKCQQLQGKGRKATPSSPAKQRSTAVKRRLDGTGH